MQVSAGLERLAGFPHTTGGQLFLIAIITAAATLSLVSGVHRGIRRLSEMNLVLAVLLLLFVLAVGPTGEILAAAPRAIVDYFAQLATRTFRLQDLYNDQAAWSRDWTVFYWGWWIAWAPFVGTFVARISRGRTIRDFLLGVLLVPTGFTFLWFLVFGTTALHLEQTAGGVADAVSADVSTAIYVVLPGAQECAMALFVSSTKATLTPPTTS